MPSIGEDTVTEHLAALNELKLLFDVITEPLPAEEAQRPRGLPKTRKEEINVGLIKKKKNRKNWQQSSILNAHPFLNSDYLKNSF